ncbi:hypothetical protein ACMTAU_00730, partial [Alcaligenes pakistanensis]
GEALSDYAHRYVKAKGVMERLSRHMDGDALSALAEGVKLNLETQE